MSHHRLRKSPAGRRGEVSVAVLKQTDFLPLFCDQHGEREIKSVQGDYVGFNAGNGEKLSNSQAEPVQAPLLGCYFVSLHLQC